MGSFWCIHQGRQIMISCRWQRMRRKNSGSRRVLGKKNYKEEARSTRDWGYNARSPCPEVFRGRLKTIATLFQKTMLG